MSIQPARATGHGGALGSTMGQDDVLHLDLKITPEELVVTEELVDTSSRRYPSVCYLNNCCRHLLIFVD